MNTCISAPKNDKEKIIAILIPILCISIGLIAIINHVLWRDEMQGWLVAIKSNSFIDLWSKNAPSGHPVLWSLLIYLVKDITKTPISMQILHWFLGSFAIIIFWLKSPFPTWQKTLFIFGFFPFWEYYIISRHYVISELLLFLFCSTYDLRKKSYIPASLYIGLLTNTQALAWGIAFACGMTLLFDWFYNSDQRKEFVKQRLWRIDLLVSLLITSSFSIFGAFSLLQVADKAGVIASFPFDSLQFLKAIGQVLGGYTLIIPNSRKWLDLVLCACVTIFLISSTLCFIRKSKSGLVFFISGTAFLFLFNYYLYIGSGARHYGYFFLILIGSLWIYLQEKNNLTYTKSNNTRPIYQKLSRIFPGIFIFCLSIHFSIGLHYMFNAFNQPFSAGKATAEYIEEKGWADQYLFGSRDTAVSIVSGYLNKEIYYPEIQDFGTYAQWNNRKPIKREEVLDEIEIFFKKNKNVKRLLIVLNEDSSLPNLALGEKIDFKNIQIVADKRFEDSRHISERFSLYWAINR